MGRPALEACGVGDPLLTPTTERGVVVLRLLDGSTRRGRVGRVRCHDPEFAQAVADVRRHDRGLPTQPVGPNKPLVAFLLSGIGVIAAMAIAETGRMNQRLQRLEQVS